MIAVELILAIGVALHPPGRNAPQGLRAVQILELIPLRATQFTGSHRGQREQTEGETRDGARIIFLGGADHPAKRNEIGDCRLTPFSQGLEDRSQLLGRIARRDTLCDTIDKDR